MKVGEKEVGEEVKTPTYVFIIQVLVQVIQAVLPKTNTKNKTNKKSNQTKYFKRQQG